MVPFMKPKWKKNNYFDLNKIVKTDLQNQKNAKLYTVSVLNVTDN